MNPARQVRVINDRRAVIENKVITYQRNAKKMQLEHQAGRRTTRRLADFD